MIDSKPFYWLVCDSCGHRSSDDGDFAGWSDEEGAVAEAIDNGWSVRSDGAAHHCSKCWDNVEPDSAGGAA